MTLVMCSSIGKHVMEYLITGLPSECRRLFGEKPSHSARGIPIHFASCSGFSLENPSSLLGPPISKHSLEDNENIP